MLRWLQNYFYCPAFAGLFSADTSSSWRPAFAGLAFPACAGRLVSANPAVAGRHKIVLQPSRFVFLKMRIISLLLQRLDSTFFAAEILNGDQYFF